MEWTGPKQGKLRKALIAIHGHRGINSLEIFISDNFTCSLDSLPTDNKEDWARALIKQFVADGSLIEALYQNLCNKNKDNEDIQALQQDLSNAPSFLGTDIKPNINVSPIFESLSPSDDFDAARAAFLQAFRLAYGRIKEHTAFTELEQVKTFLEKDRPLLAVRFSEQMAIELKAADPHRNVSPIEQWCHQMAQIHSIPINLQAPEKTPAQGYLAVALKKHGGSRQSPSFTAYFELFVTGKQESIEFAFNPVTGSVDKITKQLSAEIIRAENALGAYECGKVTVEFFLPYDYLELDVANWNTFDKRGEPLPYPFWKHRAFVVRSLDRAEESRYRAEVVRKWPFLEASIAHKQECDRFHSQTAPPDPGDLKMDLEDSAGLKLIAALPSDERDYQAIIDTIIDAAVPVALWFSAAEGMDTGSRLNEFNRLLYSCDCLTDFSTLAKQWRKWRRESPRTAAIPHLHVLCDCPDRWPTKPFDKMSLVAS